MYVIALIKSIFYRSKRIFRRKKVLLNLFPIHKEFPLRISYSFSCFSMIIFFTTSILLQQSLLNFTINQLHNLVVYIYMR